jgi:dTDP-glucose pyrophosphorylase
MKRAQNSWKRAVLDYNSKIRDAIRVLNDSSMKIVLVAKAGNVLVGTISDGDIRRGLLKGIELEDSIREIVNLNPVVVPPKISRDDVVKIMLENEVFQIPVIDENRVLKGLHLIDDSFFDNSLDNLFVIMAGGMGTRLLPKTRDLPKPMLQISGRPILEHIILRAKSQGFRRFVIAVHYLSNVIEEYFGDGSLLGVEIDYLRERVPLGTAGGLSLLQSSLNDAFIVTNGDVITDIRYRDLLDFHGKNDAFVTMSVQLNEWQNPFGVVKTDGIYMVGYEEKPILRSLINAGVYVLNPEALAFIDKETPTNMPSLFESIREKGHKILVYPIHEKWTDIGRHEDFDRAAEEFRRLEENQKWVL